MDWFCIADSAMSYEINTYLIWQPALNPHLVCIDNADNYLLGKIISRRGTITDILDRPKPFGVVFPFSLFHHWIIFKSTVMCEELGIANNYFIL